MSIADKRTYLTDLIEELKLEWPNNHTINIVCHGHSVPAGYFACAFVDTFNAYPHLFHQGLKAIFSPAVINVIVTAIGGEVSSSGAERFEKDVLCHQPRLLTIDYSLNDRGIGLEKAEAAWRTMIEKSSERNIKLILLTPTADQSEMSGCPENWDDLQQHAAQVRKLAAEYEVGLADSLAAYERYTKSGGELTDLLSWVNHPNRKGHEIVAQELMRWFPLLYSA